MSKCGGGLGHIFYQLLSL